MSKELSTRYNPSEIESKWYAHWMSKKYFHSTPDEREPFTIVIPPPNVTGVLHMGHMLNNTIQDVLIRKARQEGKNACWVPGTDHASIATEAKVVKMLRDKGIKKSELTREEFLQHAFQWKEEYGGIILQQLQKLGASCDWDRTAFTMDEPRSAEVIKAFVDLYRKGKLYRKKRMVNWDPEAKTVLSNEEVIYSMEQSRLFHVRYFIEGSSEYLVVATTRPETIPGDTAVAVHPEDPRYAHLKGKSVIVPGINRVVPIIFDAYVDMEFGTGALKVTPAHDVNDFEIGQRHDLEVIDIFNEDGTMSAESHVYVGEDRFVVRKKFVKDLEDADLIEKIEPYSNNVGRSERTNAVVEPRLSLQWYVDMKAIAGPALEAVMNDTVAFHPKNQKNVYRHWMENIKDWCISRQLWWGHRIPAYYYKDEVFVAETVEEAFAQAHEKFPNDHMSIDDLQQDEDVLDTWFSSWLWPMSVFETESERQYYYPTNVLVTGWDIIFLWVARMVMAGYEWRNERPFESVYFTGMVRDKQRRKMSKSLGNSPDALQLIEDYGADGVRFGMLSCSPAGGDLLFDEKLCEQGRNFCNKLWNAFRLVEGWQIVDQPMSDTDRLATVWIQETLKKTVVGVNQTFQEYRLSEGLIDLYNFVWNDFCSWYLEMVKPEYGSPISAELRSAVIEVFSEICTILHPFMPFITEELWHELKDRVGEDCIMSSYPNYKEYDQLIIQSVGEATQVISAVRDIRNRNGMKMRDPLPLFMTASENVQALLDLHGWKELVVKMAILENLEVGEPLDTEQQNSFIIGTNKYIVPLKLQVDIAKELEEKNKELERQRGFVLGIQKKLENEKFVASAPADVIDRERKKLNDGLERIQLLEGEIQRLTINR